MARRFAKQGFLAIAKGQIYGLSARGLAIDTGYPAEDAEFDKQYLSQVKAIKDLASLRNRSILAHGYEPLREDASARRSAHPHRRSP